jgi:2-polyprenyl-6-methoxyphenol hydroxylase-like FAD-dependent oxidoreductase
MGKKHRIAVVGAGLGGLAAAIALRQRGFDVQIYEQAAELAEFGAGSNISPNSVKFFRAAGLEAQLHAVASEPTDFSWRDFVFPSRNDRADHITTRQYARLVDDYKQTGNRAMKSQTISPAPNS